MKTQWRELGGTSFYKHYSCAQNVTLDLELSLLLASRLQKWLETQCQLEQLTNVDISTKAAMNKFFYHM